MDPIHQFEIKNFFPIARIGGIEIAFTNSALFMLIALLADPPPDDRRHRLARPGAGPAAVGRRNVLRVRRNDAAKHRRHGGHEVLPAGVLAVHVHPGAERDRHHSLHLHGHQPHHHHGLARAARLLHRGHLRLLEERAALLQAVRAERNSDLHPAAGDLHRGAVVPVAAGLPQRATVRQHAGRSHHAQGVRRLRRPCSAASASSAGSAPCCRSA